MHTYTYIHTCAMPGWRDLGSVCRYPPTRTVPKVDGFHGARAVSSDVVFSVPVIKAAHVVVVVAAHHSVP